MLSKLRIRLLKLFSFLFGVKFAKTVDTWYRFGRLLNLRKPVTLADKVAYLELTEDLAKKAFCTDKYLVRSYIVEKGLRDILVPIYQSAVQSFDEIDLQKLPSSFVIKATHGSGMNLIVLDKDKVNWEFCKSEIAKWLTIKFGEKYIEPHYLNINPRIYVEQYLGGGIKSQFPTDYKIHCLNGVPTFFQVISQKNSNQTKELMDLYDTRWNSLNHGLRQYHSVYPGNNQVGKPRQLERMLEIAKILSRDFKYVRVDLYVINDRIYFGELTFTPSQCVFPYFTDEFLLEMGYRLNIQ